MGHRCMTQTGRTPHQTAVTFPSTPTSPSKRTLAGPPGDSLDAASADDPLVRFLHELCQQHNRNQTAQTAGRRPQDALPRAAQRQADAPAEGLRWSANGRAAEREAAGTDQHELVLRVEGLERRLQDVEQQQTGGLGSLHEELAGLRAQVRTLGWTRAGGAASADAAEQGARAPTASTPRSSPWRRCPMTSRSCAGLLRWSSSGASDVRRSRPTGPRSRGLEAEVRMLELETAPDRRAPAHPCHPLRSPGNGGDGSGSWRDGKSGWGAARRALRRARWRRRLAPAPASAPGVAPGARGLAPLASGAVAASDRTGDGAISVQAGFGLCCGRWANWRGTASRCCAGERSR